MVSEVNSSLFTFSVSTHAFDCRIIPLLLACDRKLCRVCVDAVKSGEWPIDQEKLTAMKEKFYNEKKQMKKRGMKSELFSVCACAWSSKPRVTFARFFSIKKKKHFKPCSLDRQKRK